MTASVPVDWQLNETYFVVAHIHYVLIGINLFPVLGALFTWFPKMTGRMLDERLGKWGFWLNFIGFNLAFLPMHLTGLRGMPRRIYTYPPRMGFGTLNLITSIGAFGPSGGRPSCFAQCHRQPKKRAAGRRQSWDASSLEWAVPSPPPIQFRRNPHRREPTSALGGPPSGERRPLHDQQGLSSRTWPRNDRHNPLDGDPELILRMPQDSYSPLVLTLGISLGFAGLLIRNWWAVWIGAIVIALSILVWLWPRRRMLQRVQVAS